MFELLESLFTSKQSSKAQKLRSKRTEDDFFKRSILKFFLNPHKLVHWPVVSINNNLKLMFDINEIYTQKCGQKYSLYTIWFYIKHHSEVHPSKIEWKIYFIQIYFYHWLMLMDGSAIQSLLYLVKQPWANTTCHFLNEVVHQSRGEIANCHFLFL